MMHGKKKTFKLFPAGETIAKQQVIEGMMCKRRIPTVWFDPVFLAK